MTEPGPPPDYALNPDTLETGIALYLDPLIADLGVVRDSYASAHAEIATAHATEAPGWFGGEGNGDVRAASSSFLNEVEWQLQRVAGEQTELVASLQEYAAFLRAHIQWARETDQKHADNFHAIHRELLDGPRW